MFSLSADFAGASATPPLALTWPQALDFLSRADGIALLAAGVVGCFLGWVAGRARRGARPVAREGSEVRSLPELKWRHEKLVLVERQQVEKQQRLDEFVEASRDWEKRESLAAALALFVMGERVREARQKVGSDLSRMSMLRDRLDAIASSLQRGCEAVGACRGMAESQAARLEEAREALRGIADEVLAMEGSRSGRGLDLSEPKALRQRLKELKSQMVALPQGWATSAEETDRRIRELLATIDEPALEPVRSVLLVDGSLTASLAGAAGIDLVGAVSAAIRAVDALAKVQEAALEESKQAAEGGAELAPSVPESSGESLPLRSAAPVAASDSPPAEDPLVALTEALASASLGSQPEASSSDWTEAAAPAINEGFSIRLGATPPSLPGFQAPQDLLPPTAPAAKGFHDLTNGMGSARHDVVRADTLPPVGENGERSLVLFCSNDVELWGKTIYRGARCRARAIEEFPKWANWISIRRLDTDERVFAPIRTASLRNRHATDPYGFNGTNELFYGARHLGFFSESCPNEVETRFTYGGWGFGHRSNEITTGVEQLQAAGWEGREIPADTVFEIAIHEELPSLGAKDRLLEWAKC